MATIQDISIVRGDTLEYAIEFSMQGRPIDITGSTVYFTVRKPETMNNKTDRNVVLKKNITEHTDPKKGETFIQIPAQEMQHVEPGQYYWDVQLKDYADTVQTFVMGILEVVNDVTKRFN